MEFFPGLVARHSGHPVVFTASGIHKIEPTDQQVPVDSSVYDFAITSDSRFGYVHTPHRLFLIDFKDPDAPIDITDHFFHIQLVRWISDSTLAVLHCESSLSIFPVTDLTVTLTLPPLNPPISAFAGDDRGVIAGAGTRLIWLGPNASLPEPHHEIDLGHQILFLSLSGDYVYASTLSGIFAVRLFSLTTGDAQPQLISRMMDVTGIVGKFVVSTQGAFELDGYDMWKVFDGEVAGICDDPFTVVEPSGTIQREKKQKLGLFDDFARDSLFADVQRLQMRRKKLIAKQAALNRRAADIMSKWNRLAELYVRLEKLEASLQKGKKQEGNHHLNIGKLMRRKETIEKRYQESPMWKKLHENADLSKEKDGLGDPSRKLESHERMGSSK